jgi:Tol biopolymer transport system component
LVEVGGGSEASTGDVYVVNADRGTARLVAGGVDGGEEPRWSPDGAHVLVSVFRHGSDDVFSYPVDDGRPVDLTPTRGAWEFEARWSPDGTRVAFLSQRHDSDNDLYVVPASGGRPRLVVRHVDGLAWSPDGRLIAFSPGLASPHFGLLVVPASGGRPRALGAGAGERLEWGPGRRLLHTGSGAMIPHPTYLWTGTEDKEVGIVGDAQFLPDGTVAFGGSGRTIGFLRPNGTRRAVRLPGRPTSFAWSPDGHYLAFADAWSGNVYVARADGGGPRLDVSLGTQIEVFGWQPRPF